MPFLYVWLDAMASTATLELEGKTACLDQAVTPNLHRFYRVGESFAVKNWTVSSRNSG